MGNVEKHQTDNRPIGVIDSGVGGLTVVRELRRVLPDETILYFGDSANCPYGNRSREEIIRLTEDMLMRMEASDVKLVIVACNTISALVEHYAGKHSFPIIGIIEPAVHQLVQTGERRFGLIATEFTVSSGCYQDSMEKLDPGHEIVGAPSKTLAALIDQGKYDGTEVEEEVTRLIDQLFGAESQWEDEEHQIHTVVLGCTHFPIVQSIFQKKAPADVRFIDPANAQAEVAKRILKTRGMLAPSGGRSRGPHRSAVTVRTSGNPELYVPMLKKLEIEAEL